MKSVILPLSRALVLLSRLFSRFRIRFDATSSSSPVKVTCYAKVTCFAFCVRLIWDLFMFYFQDWPSRKNTLRRRGMRFVHFVSVCVTLQICKALGAAATFAAAKPRRVVCRSIEIIRTYESEGADKSRCGVSFLEAAKDISGSGMCVSSSISAGFQSIYATLSPQITQRYRK